MAKEKIKKVDIEITRLIPKGLDRIAYFVSNTKKQIENFSRGTIREEEITSLGEHYNMESAAEMIESLEIEVETEKLILYKELRKITKLMKENRIEDQKKRAGELQNELGQNVMT